MAMLLSPTYDCRAILPFVTPPAQVKMVTTFFNIEKDVVSVTKTLNFST